MMKQYETTFILDSHLSHDEMERCIQKYSQFIEKQKGTIKFIDRWGKRRLAYEINKKQYGYYIYMRFEGDGSIVKPLEKEFKLDDQCLRYLTILVPKSVIQEEETKPKIKSKETSVEDKENENQEDLKTDSKEQIEFDGSETSA